MIFINIVTWNSMKYLPDALRSIFSQTHKNFKVLIIDNGSEDGTIKFLRNEYPQVLILKNVKNLGFAAAHNQGIKLALNSSLKYGYGLDKSYILITNPDIILKPNFLEKIIEKADNFSDSGSFGGKLKKVLNNNINLDSNIIDTTGLKIFNTRRVVERGAGECDEGQFQDGEVFGNSGALVLYRLSALQDIEVQNEYFDSKFFSYKEDIDLAWRLRLFGWKSFYIENAVAHHHRGAYGSENRTMSKAINERRKKNSLINYYSTTNHFSILLKNEFAKNIVKDLPYIFLYEAGKFLYILFFETKTLRAYFKFLKSFSYVWKQRKEIMSRKKVNAEDMRKWIC